MSPFLKDAHMKAFKKIKKFIKEAGPGLGFFYGVYAWAEYEHKQIAFHHRS